ncbi:MAG: asparaginase [Cohaesibacter sp.]|nr:asparaginase [Cohaesibacter sp.]
MAALVEVTRGNWVESWHDGAIAVVDSKGKIVRQIGDIERPVFPRSAIKGLQALPLIESGAADAYALSQEAISIACASHNGEEIHAQASKEMLSACGLTASALECGAQSPKFEVDQAHLHRQNLQATALHNNCSGKHAGFLCFSQKAGFDYQGYVRPDHPVQCEIRAVLEEMTETRNLGEGSMSWCGTDGCSIPTYALPLKNWAHAFAKFATGQGMKPQRAKAAERLRAAVASAPYMVAGHDRYCTGIMQTLKERAFVKIGAEGVFCAAFPELGLGVALKCWDGSFRAAERMMTGVIEAFLPLSEAEQTALADYKLIQMKNWNGIHVGDIRLNDGVLEHLRGA